jgi:peptide subunit release factor 1 (eRF1)
MKFTSRSQIESLGHLQAGDLWISSLYLDTDKSRLTRKEIGLMLKNLLNEARGKLEPMDLAKANKDSLCQDLEKIGAFAGQSILSSSAPGLAAFSCAGAGLWQDFTLPRAPRNHLVFARGAYLRPLTVILDEFHPICALILERQEARWYSVFMGEISLLNRLASEVPSRVREGGFEGTEARRIERHIDAHLHDHFKKAAQMTFELSRKSHFDWLFLGCQEEYRPVFEPLLHPYILERLKGHLKINGYDETESKILKQALEIEQTLRLAEETSLGQNLVSELEKGGRAVSGLREVLHKLNVHEVQTLILNRNFSQAGLVCPKCRFLYLNEVRCPNCQVKTDKVDDIVHEGVHAAMDHKGQVRYVTRPSKLDHFGEIGAFLRFKT